MAFLWANFGAFSSGILPYWKQLETNNVLVAFSGALILNQNLEPIYSVQIDPKDILEINTVLAEHPLLGVNYYTIMIAMLVT